MALKENYRELLIDAVVRVAAREGLDRTTTKLIAAEVPCNEVYIYRNFGSKDALLQAAFSRTDLRFVQTVLKNLDVMDAPGQPLEQRCRALWEPVWRFCLARPDASRTAATGGFGIGLSIAKSIAEAHHGTIRASVQESRITFAAELK